MRDRWSQGLDSIRDPLLDSTRYNSDTKVWTVHTELEFVRLIGGLQWLNPTHNLWFRGERHFYPTVLPRRYRQGVDQAQTEILARWLSRQAQYDRAIRDRSSLARAAILQHYGCPTSLIDLSLSHDTACAFATEGDGTPHVRVYSLPRHTEPVTVFDDADIVLVDLRAELPSYCMRPHVQQAAFLARRRAVYQDILPGSTVSDEDASLDDLCIAHIRLDIPNAKHRFFCPRARVRALYPPPSENCDASRGQKTMDGDYLLCLLKHRSSAEPHGISTFPDSYSDNPPDASCCAPAFHP